MCECLLFLSLYFNATLVPSLSSLQILLREEQTVCLFIAKWSVLKICIQVTFHGIDRYNWNRSIFKYIDKYHRWTFFFVVMVAAGQKEQRRTFSFSWMYTELYLKINTFIDNYFTMLKNILEVSKMQVSI